jgi:hypothetical protein
LSDSGEWAVVTASTKLERRQIIMELVTMTTKGRTLILDIMARSMHNVDIESANS